MTYRPAYIAIIALLLSILACGLPTTEYAIGTPAPAPTPLAVEFVTVTAYSVYIRNADGERIGYATQGQKLTGKVDGNYFVTSQGRVWLGCVSVESGLGCESE